MEASGDAVFCCVTARAAPSGGNVSIGLEACDQFGLPGNLALTSGPHPRRVFARSTVGRESAKPVGFSFQRKILYDGNS